MSREGEIILKALTVARGVQLKHSYMLLKYGSLVASRPFAVLIYTVCLALGISRTCVHFFFFPRTLHHIGSKYVQREWYILFSQFKYIASIRGK